MTYARKLLVALIALLLPLQSMAAAATFVQCHEQAAAQIFAAAGADHTHSPGTAHHEHDDEDTSSGLSATHLCGHFVLHAPTSLEFAQAPALAAWSPRGLVSYTPHFPEHPRRPPRT